MAKVNLVNLNHVMEQLEELKREGAEKIVINLHVRQNGERNTAPRSQPNGLM